jgi:hypothetical protein
MAEPEHDDYKRYPDEQGDGVRDHEHWIPGCHSVGNPEQESGKQDHEIAQGHIA